MNIEPKSQPINSNEICTESCCTNTDDDRKIKCAKCKRQVHFVCTNLPIYQLSLFFSKNYRSFICVNCVEIPKEFRANYNNQEENMINQFKREVKACENIIKVQKENEGKLINGLRKMKHQQDEQDSLKQFMENKFDELEKNIKETIAEDVKGKLDNKDNKNKSLNEEATKTFASIVKINQENALLPQFRKLLHNEKLQDIEEERQKDVRKSNLIIYGKKESEELNSDEKFVQNFVDDVGSDSKVKYITRIGNKRENYTRPIKVVFENPHQIYLIMKSLKKLKGNFQYQGISITEDFTQFERSIIKEWKNKAPERNARESIDSNFVWRVRGSPKSSLYLKKIFATKSS